MVVIASERQGELVVTLREGAVSASLEFEIAVGEGLEFSERTSNGISFSRRAAQLHDGSLRPLFVRQRARPRPL